MIKFKVEYVEDGKDIKVEFATLEAAESWKAIFAPLAEIVEFDDPTATDVKPKIYPVLKPSQLKKCLVLNGISLSAVEGLINTYPEPQRSLAMIDWQSSLEMHRDHALVSAMSSALGLSEAQVDAMWEYGVGL